MNEKSMTLDGQPIEEKILYEKMEEDRSNKKLIKEISPMNLRLYNSFEIKI